MDSDNNSEELMHYVIYFNENQTRINDNNQEVIYNGYVDDTNNQTNIVVPVLQIPIDNSVTKIQRHAYEGCKSLLMAGFLPNSLQKIGNHAFALCSSLQSVGGTANIEQHEHGQGQGLGQEREYENEQGHDHANLTGMMPKQSSLPEPALQIGADDIVHCDGHNNGTSFGDDNDGGDDGEDGASSVTVAVPSTTGWKCIQFPQSIVELGPGAFYKCPDLTTLWIPSSVRFIEAHSFHFCTGLVEVDLSNISIKTVAPHTFWGCSSLSIVQLPESLEEISTGGFGFCRQLSSIQFPSLLREIDVSAFAGCTSLSIVEFPSKIQKIASTAFRGCSALETVKVHRDDDKVDDDDGSDDSSGHLIRAINAETFAYCTSLKNVSFPTSVRVIQSAAFYACRALTRLVMLPNSIQEISRDAFMDCQNLQHVTIPSSVQRIGQMTFSGCTKLSCIKFEHPCSISVIESRTFSNCVHLDNVQLPDSILEIGEGAFSNCIRLSNIRLSNSLYKIGFSAFRSCRNLTNVNLPIRYYGSFHAVAKSTHDDDDDDNYQNQNNHRSENDNNTNDGSFGRTAICLDLPDTLYDIEEKAFHGCQGLTSVFSTLSIRFHCDVIRGGGRFIQRRKVRKLRKKNNNRTGHWRKQVMGILDETTRRSTGPGNENNHQTDVSHPSSLWPLILHRILYRMKLPKESIFQPHETNPTAVGRGRRNGHDDDDVDKDPGQWYTQNDDIRRQSVVYHLLVHGVAMEQ